jgi:hypothetical protein
LPGGYRSEVLEVAMNDIHVLKTTTGFTVKVKVDVETLQLCCEWSSPPPYIRRRFKRLLREYWPWRDGIIQEAANRLGKSVLVFTPLPSGGLSHTFIKPRIEVGP